MSGPPSLSLRWRPLAPLLLSTGAALLVVAVATRDPTPLFLALPLLLAPVAAGIAGPRSSPSVRVDVSVEGATTDVKVRGTVTPEPSVDARNLLVNSTDR